MFTLKLKWLKQYRSYMMNCQKIPLFGGIILMCIYILILGLYVCISYLIYGMLLWFLGHFLEILFCSQHSKVQARYYLHFVDENMEVEGFSYQPTIFNQGWFCPREGISQQLETFLDITAVEMLQDSLLKNFLAQMSILLSLSNPILDQDNCRQ